MPKSSRDDVDPLNLVLLFAHAVDRARAVTGRALSPEEALVFIARHYVAKHGARVEQRAKHGSS